MEELGKQGILRIDPIDELNTYQSGQSSMGAPTGGTAPGDSGYQRDILGSSTVDRENAHRQSQTRP